jgi:hypothetical protein
MASGGTSLSDNFKRFATKADGKEATTADINKWCKDAGVVGKNCNSNHIDISFSKVKAKASKNITFGEMEALIAEMAKKYKDDHKLDEAKAKDEIRDKLAKAQHKTHGTTQAAKVGGVDRLTDTSKYTGSHKERFDESGKGKGKEGRADTTQNTGYVGNYKGEGTYDKK